MRYTSTVVAIWWLRLFTDVRGAIRMNDSALSPVVAVENGTEDVTLRCPYTLGPRDDFGLTVRWAYQSNDAVIYQWMPGNEPTVPKSQAEVIDISHESSSEHNHRYSDLKLLSPTLQLTGLYVCRVASLESEASTTVRLVVYSLPPQLNMTLTEEDGNITVTCLSGPTFPEPHLAITLTDKHGDNVDLLRDTVVSYWDSEYEVVQWGLLPIDIEPGYKLECRLTIQYTDLSMIDEIVTEAVEEDQVTTTEEPESDTTSIIVNVPEEDDSQIKIEPVAVKTKESDTTSIIVNVPEEDDSQTKIEPVAVKTKGTGTRNLGSWWLPFLAAALTRFLME